MTTLEEIYLPDKIPSMDSEIDVEINDADLVDSNSENFQDLDIPEIESQSTEKKVTATESKEQSIESSVISPTVEAQNEVVTEKLQTQETTHITSVEKTLKETSPTTQPKRLLKLTGTSLTNTQITQNELGVPSGKPSNVVDNSAKPRMIKLNTTSRSTAITNQAKPQATPKATQNLPSKASATPSQKQKNKIPAPKTTTVPTLSGSQNSFVLTPSPVGKSENNPKQVPKAPEPVVPSPQTNEKPAEPASKSKIIEVAASQRTNGSWRKPVRIRAGYVPPEERANKLKQKQDQEDDEEEIDIMTDEREADAESDSSQPQKTNKRSAQSMDSDTDETQRARPNQGYISRLVNSNFTFNTKILPMSLEDKNLLNEDDGAVETLFNESTNNLLSTIDEMRRLQGIILLKHIAKSYGIKIKIDDYEDAENTDISETETNDAEGQAAKRRKLTSSMKEAIRKGRQVRIKQVQGAIGYRST